MVIMSVVNVGMAMEMGVVSVDMEMGVVDGECG